MGMIEINNLTKYVVDRKKFSTVAKKVLKGENKETETLSLAFVSKDEIQGLNKKYRKKNRPTDVLSFALKDGKNLGEIVICPDVVKENAEKYGVLAKDEMMKVFVHGILHLLDYDHEKSEKEAEEMEKKQEFYLSKVK
jgi:probable rRNA maturation factor